MLSERAWAALQSREVSDSRTLLQSGDWHETSYDWATVSIAQQLRTKLAAASQKRVLFLSVAADFPKHHVPKDIFRWMQAVPSMTATKRTYGGFAGVPWRHSSLDSYHLAARVSA